MRTFWSRYRKAKSLFLLRKYQLCIDESSALLELDGGNGEAAFLVEKSNQELVKIAHVVENARRLRSELEGSWKSAYGIAEDIGVKLGYTASNYLDFLPQLSSVEKLPRRDEEGQPIWPVLLLYPQYNQIDIIRVIAPYIFAIHVIGKLLCSPLCPYSRRRITLSTHAYLSWRLLSRP